MSRERKRSAIIRRIARKVSVLDDQRGSAAKSRHRIDSRAFSPSDRKITLLPSGESSGWRSFAGLDVRRRGSPAEVCWIQISRLPSPARSHAYTRNLPSWELTGSVVSPESRVNCMGGRGSE